MSRAKKYAGGVPGAASSDAQTASRKSHKAGRKKRRGKGK